jgi:hypothetical protein
MLVLLEFPFQILGDFFQNRKRPDPQLEGGEGAGLGGIAEGMDVLASIGAPI